MYNSVYIYKMGIIHIMQKSIATQEEDSFIIKFEAGDRTRGIAALFRSGLVCSGNGDVFVVNEQHIELLKQMNIKYTQIS
jgi:hypothetical protein